MYYQLSPSPDLMGKEETYATWENGFSDEDMKALIVAGELSAQRAGSVGNGTVDPVIRRSQVAWLECTAENTWLYNKMGFITRQINGQFFDFDITGFGEPMQYTVYKDDGGHYDWHMDKGMNSNIPRKLSLVLQLSDPSEYEGGFLELMTGRNVIQMERRKGLVVAFPSWVLHRVTPVTAGIRRSLVVWSGGPKFR